MVVLTGIVYVIARNTIEREINNSNLLLLESVRDNIDRALAEINDLSMEILASPEIQEASALSEGDMAYYYKLYKAAQSLFNYKTLKSDFQSYYIYFGDIGRVMRPGIVNFEGLYYDNYIQNGNFGYGQWKEAVSRLYYGEYITMPHRDAVTGNTFNLAFIRSMPFPSLNDEVTNIVIMMNINKILDRGSQDRGIAVLDGNNNIIAQSRLEAALETGGLPAMPGDHGIFTTRSNGLREVISYIASREYNWKYITVTPENVYWERASFIRFIMWGEILLCVLGMGALSFYFVRRNYNILSEITSFIRSKLNSETIYRGNEFSYIRQVLSQSIEEKQEAESRLDQQLITLRNNLLIGLMEGNEMSVPLDELLTSYNIHFPHPHYSVVAVYIEHVNPELWGGQDKNTYTIAKMAVMNLMEDILNRNDSQGGGPRSNTAYVTDFRDHILCVINTSLRWLEFRSALDEDLKSARDIITQKYDMDIYIAVGGLYNTPEDIHRACNDAQSSIDYARILGRGQTVFFGDLGSHDTDSGVYPFNKERILLNHLHLADFTAVSALVNGLFHDDLLKLSVSQETLHFIVLSLTAQLLRNVCADEEELNRFLDRNGEGIAQLVKCKTIMDMKEPMLRLLKCAIDTEASPEKKNQLGAVIQNYITSHYTDPLLNIESIAEAVKKSPYYISKKFKMETGSGILDFINKVRIDNAKALLQDTGLTQAQVAEKVGFTSVRTYHRAFKKMEGVTPGQFKQADQG
ncbi:putative HTH-type transcriptional regulator YtdP [Spirochaetia bacterium]|nr:putative HTH-type transcriptional regulator YtdP [Spirochaetia bacterium]